MCIRDRCSESQTDSDLDGVFNDVDQCPNTTLLDLNGDGQFDIDSVGCSPIQYDDDNDMMTTQSTFVQLLH